MDNYPRLIHTSKEDPGFHIIKSTYLGKFVRTYCKYLTDCQIEVPMVDPRWVCDKCLKGWKKQSG